MKAIYKGRYTDRYNQCVVYLVYEYRGYEYEIKADSNKGNESLGWQHKSEQARIDELIRLDEVEKKRKNVPHISVDEAIAEFLMMCE